MTICRFVHLSDIHFGQERQGKRVLHDNVREELLRDCVSQRAALGPANGILVTGDTAFSGKQAEYERAGEWLDHLTQVVDCSQFEVSVIPGNHDVDLDRIEYAGELLHRDLRESPLGTLDAKLERIAKSNEENNPLLPKLAAYREFAARYSCDFESVLRPIWQKNYSLGEASILRFVGLNSVQVCDSSDASGRMVLGNNQYVLSTYDNIEYIVMLHHPLHWFRDYDQAKQYIKRAKVIMTGHEHNLDIRKISEGNGIEYLEICAGATNSPEGSSLYQYRYNWIEIELSGSNGNSLIVTVYPRVWEPSQVKFVPDQNRLGGTTSRVIPLACPNFRVPARSKLIGATPDTAPEGQSTGDVHSAPDATEVDTVKGVSPMECDKSEQFARLRYYFWRYLGWQERLKVLVEHDILPSTTTQPLPQTMERLALDMACKQGKLPQLWTAIMQLVPEDKREANPFTQEGK